MKPQLAGLVLLLLLSCSGEKEQDSANSAFRLISYNVWYGFTEVPDRKAMWLNWMREQHPDVVSLQELNEYTPEQLAQDAESWGNPYSVLLKEEGFPTGLTSRYPIEDVKRYLDGFHHGLLRARIKGIYFYVIHLHPSNWQTRVKEIDLILDNINSLPPNSSVVLVGDFNTFSSRDSIYYAHGRLEPFFGQRDSAYQERNLNDGRLDYSVLDRLSDSGFVDLEYHFRPPDFTFTGSFPSKIEKEGAHGDLRRLDYVFISPDLLDQALAAAIIADDTTQVLSDHLPVRVDFRLTSQE
jgi:endonuclease/exonuclease/phosphatase family metal-dependent hydrolase